MEYVFLFSWPVLEKCSSKLLEEFLAVGTWRANGLWIIMPKFYCDYCDMNLTHDSPSVRKTHCSGLKHKENVKDNSQRWMKEQARA